MSRSSITLALNLAGPSRWRSPSRVMQAGSYRQCGQTHFTPISTILRFASTSPPTRPPPPTRSTSSQPLRPRDVAERRLREASKPVQTGFQASTQDWPWVDMESRVKDTTAQQRLIYVRPFEGNFGPSEKFLLFYMAFGVVVFFLVGGNVYIHLTTSDRLEEIDNFWFQSARGLFPSFAVIGLTTFGVTISKTTKSQWKTITRLSQVRVRHLKDDRVDQFIRMRHGLHGISLGLFPEYRDVKLENIKLKSLGQHRVRMVIQEPGRKQEWFEIPLHESRHIRETDQEVVMSVRRLALTFGSITLRSTEELKNEHMSGWFLKLMDKVFGYKWGDAEKATGDKK